MSKMAQAMVEQRPSFMPASAGLLQRKCDKCRKKRQLLQRSSAEQAGPSAVPPIVHDVLNSPGHPLDAETQAFFEPRFGHDFGKIQVHSVAPQASMSDLKIGPSNDSYEKEADQVADRMMRTPQFNEPNRQEKARFDLSRVRLHTDARAAKSAQAIGARAFTIGRNIVFGLGQYQPGTREGVKLLAHELVHFAQQNNSSSKGSIQMEGIDGDYANNSGADASGYLGGDNSDPKSIIVGCGSSNDLKIHASWESNEFAVSGDKILTINCYNTGWDYDNCEGGTFSVQLQKSTFLGYDNIGDPHKFSVGRDEGVAYSVEDLGGQGDFRIVIQVYQDYRVKDPRNWGDCSLMIKPLSIIC